MIERVAGAWGKAVMRAVMMPVVAAFVALSLVAAAQAAGRDKVEAFLKVTGFDVALDSIALAAEDAPAMLGMRADDFGYQWKRAAADVFDTAQMREMALGLLEKTLSDDLLDHAAGFYATPLGLRLVEAENISHLHEDDDAKRKAGDALVDEMREGDPERMRMLARMNEAIDASGMGLKAVQEIQLRFLLAADRAGVLHLKIDEDELRAMLARNEQEMRASMAASALANSAWTYRDFSTGELQTYTEALEDERMQQVYDLMNAIQWEIMANRFEALATRMAGMTKGEEL